jgi:hypothetical protein
MNLTEFMRDYKLQKEKSDEPVFVKPPKAPKPPKPPKEPKSPKPTKEKVEKKPRVKIYKPPKQGKTKIEKKRKDIEARLAYNDARANQFRESLMRNNTLDLPVS